MKKRSFKILSGLLGLALVTLACSISIPGQAPSEETLATSVAATFTAMSAPHSLPTEATPEVATVAPTPEPVVAPVTVSFIDGERNLYVWVDGTAAPVKLTNTGDVQDSVVSPDGTLIAAVRGADYLNYRLDLIRSDGSSTTTLIDFTSLPRPADSEALIPYQVIWMPGTHNLLVNARIQYMGPGLQIAEPLYLVNADTAAQSVLMNVSGNWRFGLSPDGSKLVISHADGVDLYTSAGSLIRANVISHDLINTASEYQWTGVASWKSDSSAFALAVPPLEPFATTPGNGTSYLVTAAGDAAVQYTGAMSFFPSGVATYNHQLTKYAFTVQLEPVLDNQWALHIANLDGGADVVVANGYFSTYPVWAPDDQHFIFTNLSGSNHQAYLGSSDGSTVILADLPSLLNIRWLDNSRYIAANYDGSSYTLVLGTIGSGNTVIYSEPASSSTGGFPIPFDVNR
ncbi:MAG: hypothetical protein VB013_09340 [Anaerolineaceae bacterium]|nr:hypothetical protein [Anaerolineaceae bacterium]